MIRSDALASGKMAFVRGPRYERLYAQSGIRVIQYEAFLAGLM